MANIHKKKFFGIPEALLLGKKALGVGQVFVFIIAALSFALIMIFGYKAIGDFLAQGEKVQFYQFKTDVETSIQRVYSERCEYGK